MLKIIKTTDGRGYMVCSPTGEHLGCWATLSEAALDAAYWIANGFGFDCQFEEEIPLS